MKDVSDGLNSVLKTDDEMKIFGQSGKRLLSHHFRHIIGMSTMELRVIKKNQK